MVRTEYLRPEMTELRARDARAILDFLAGVEQLEDVDAFRSGILPGLQRLVPCETVTYNELPRPGDGGPVWVSSPRESAEQADAEAFMRHAEQQPVIAYWSQTGDVRPMKFSDFLTATALHRLDLWDAFFRPLGIEHLLAITLHGMSFPLVGVALCRPRGGDFGERDREILEVLRPHLAAAYRRAEQRGRARQVLRALEHADDEAVVFVERDGGLEPATTERPGWLAGMLDDPLLREWLGGGPASEVVELRAATVTYLRAPPGGTDTLLVRRRRSGVDTAALAARGLTPRELDVVRCAVDGQTVAQIAQTLFLSEGTVEKHLAHVYEKLAVHSRAAAVAVALGRQAAD